MSSAPAEASYTNLRPALQRHKAGRGRPAAQALQQKQQTISDQACHTYTFL